jgi:DNA-binding NarL/FixJ family response regulator
MATSRILQGSKLLLVSRDDLVRKTFTSVVAELGGDLLWEPRTAIVAQHALHSRIDGVIIDAEADDALNLIGTLKNHKSSKHAIIFAYASSPAQAKGGRQAGTNFTLLKPISYQQVVQTLSVASSFIMEAQKKYFRHRVTLPINIVHPGARHKAITENMSETGMAISTLDRLEQGSSLEFSFELPGKANIEGLGQVIWNDLNGRAGINFEVLMSTGQTDLPGWLSTM